MTGTLASPGQIRSVKGYRGYETCEQSQAQVDIKYTNTLLIGNGSFGVVYKAKLVDADESVAIKKVLQDRRFKNRELQIMKQLQHQNIVRLLFYFYSKGEKGNDEYLNLILEYLPDTISRVERLYSKCKQSIPTFFVKLYMYQVFRALAYIHSKGICHRDVKPQNLLLNTETAQLKLCDFGSAKYLIMGESNVSYICSRYYRAPELIFGADNYSTSVDIWSAGCVFGEMLLGKAMFTGDSGVDQLVEIIKLLGTPDANQLAKMNPNFSSFEFPKIRAQSLARFFGPRVPQDATDLMTRLLEYTPGQRSTALGACAHPFFDELRHTDCRLPSGRELPPLFNFTQHELGIEPLLNAKLIPNHHLLLMSAKQSDDVLSMETTVNRLSQDNSEICVDGVISTNHRDDSNKDDVIMVDNDDVIKVQQEGKDSDDQINKLIDKGLKSMHF